MNSNIIFNENEGFGNPNYSEVRTLLQMVVENMLTALDIATI